MTYRSIKILTVSTLALSAFLACTPMARAHDVAEQGQAAQSQATVPEQPNYISGGVGEESRAELDAVQKNYGLKVVFAGEGGIFLDDVHVTITDAAKQSVLVVDPEGPILLAQLKPGKYVITADAQGITQKATVTIRKNKQTNITMRFPIGE